MSLMRPTSDLLSDFPKRLSLEDRPAVTIRPLVADDEAQLRTFFAGIPDNDRWWLREDVGDPVVVRRWLEDLNYDRVFPLIALDGDTIIADATLHRRGFGAHAHLGEVRVVVAPPYRGRGLAYALLAELVEIALQAGLERLEAEIVAGAQAGALEAVEQLGFETVAVLPNHLRSRTGAKHDLIILVLLLSG